MHIAVIAHRVPYPPNKGEKLRTFHQLEYLVSEGHQLSVFCPADSVEDLDNAKQLSTRLNIQVITAKRAAKFMRLLQALVYNKSFSESEFYSRNLSIQLSALSSPADALLFTASSLTPYLKYVNQSQNCIKLIDFMDVDSDKWLQYAQSATWPMSAVYKREHNKIAKLEQQAIAEFDTAFVISTNEQEMFNRDVVKTEKLKVLGNGIEHDVFSPSANKSESSINLLFTGVMDYKPNIDAVHWFVDKCWPSLKAKVPNITFTVAGMNPTKSILQLSNDSQITITGFVEDIMPYYDQAHLFVAPFNIARGVQNKVLQAMSCGIPVITTDLGAEGIKCIANKDIVIANSSGEFTNQCIELATNELKRAELAQAARDTILKHYAWDSVLMPLRDSLQTS